MEPRITVRTVTETYDVWTITIGEYHQSGRFVELPGEVEVVCRGTPTLHARGATRDEALQEMAGLMRMWIDNREQFMARTAHGMAEIAAGRVISLEDLRARYGLGH